MTTQSARNAYAAAHRILREVYGPSIGAKFATPGKRRSVMVETIAEIILEEHGNTESVRVTGEGTQMQSHLQGCDR